jgi:hypothetical protein
MKTVVLWDTSQRLRETWYPTSANTQRLKKLPSTTIKSQYSTESILAATQENSGKPACSLLCIIYEDERLSETSGSHGGEIKDNCVLSCCAVLSGRSI